MKRPHGLGIALLSLSLMFAISVGEFYAIHYLRLPDMPLNAAELMSCVFFISVLTRQILVRPVQAGEEWTMTGEKPRSWPGLVLALGTGTLAYSTTVPLFFITDDYDHLQLVRQPFMTSIWPQITQGQAGDNFHIFYRPLGFLSLFLDYRIWHSWIPGYHLTNLALYLLCVAAVFFLCRELRLQNDVCTMAALVFALLPVNVQAVTWVACRFDQLATAFMVWALVCSVRFRRTGSWLAYAGSMVLFLMAALTKESAYSLPFLWIALEFLPIDRKQLEPRLSLKRLGPVFGYLGVAALAFLHRWRVLGGIAGYYDPNGAPVVQTFGAQNLLGLLVRAPSEMLLGYNTFQPGRIPLILLVVIAATIFLTSSLLEKKTSYSWRLIWVSLVWIFTSTIPVHFNFRLVDPGLFNSRGLYFGSVGLALLIALLLHGASQQPRSRRVWAGALSLVLVAGVEHNIGAWKAVSHTTYSFLSQLRTLEPSPPPNTAFYIDDRPTFVRGVPFFTVGLQSAVRFDYGWRTDITAEPLTQSSPVWRPDAICVMWWDGRHPYATEPGELLEPKAFRINAAPSWGSSHSPALP